MTDEPEGKAKPYVEKNKMEYLVGVGGGAGAYRTNGIPNAWLIDPDGKIVYDGHPSRITAAMVEKYLDDVLLPPEIDLELDFGRAQKPLKSGNYGKAINEFDKIIDKSDDSELVARATETKARLEEYGRSVLTLVDTLATKGSHVAGMKKLDYLSTVFKRTEIGDLADAKIAEWKKDDTIQAELKGAQIVAQAREKMAKGKHKDAAKLLNAVVQGKKYEGTKIRDVAKELFDEVVEKL